MVSKCANPQCSEQFRFLHEGRLFQLTPTPEVQVISEDDNPALYERFWLCDRCSKQMTLVWAGTRAKLISLPSEAVALPAVTATQVVAQKQSRKWLSNAASRNR